MEGAWQRKQALAEEVKEKKEEKTEEKVADGQTGDVGYAHTTFLRPTNPNQMDLWLSQLKPESPDPSNEYGWCWGCFSHQINTHGGSGTEMKVDGYFEPTDDTDIEFFMIKNNNHKKKSFFLIMIIKTLRKLKYVYENLKITDNSSS